jgi:hypothetical protein
MFGYRLVLVQSLHRQGAPGGFHRGARIPAGGTLRACECDVELQEGDGAWRRTSEDRDMVCEVWGSGVIKCSSGVGAGRCVQ